MSRPGHRNSKRSSNRARIIIKNLLLVFIVGYILTAGFKYVREVFKANLVDVELANYGSIEETIVFQGVLVRDETVLTVPAGGKLQIVAPEGERLRVGAPVAKVRTPDVNSRNGEKISNINSPVAGIVSYELDGLENILTPGNIAKINIPDIWNKNKGRGEVKITDGKEVRGGEAVAKVVNNLSAMYVVGEIAEKKLPLSKLKTWQHFLIKVDQDEEQPVYLDISEVIPAGDNNIVILKLNNFAGDFIRRRVHGFTVITERYEGYIVPAEAIVSRDGEKGLFTVYKSSVRWQPVKIVGRIGEKVAVSGLAPDTSYIDNPQYTQEGQAIH